jgi:hypothetical protein
VQLDKNYYIEMVTKYFPDAANVVVVSDDPKWCEKNLPWSVVSSDSPGVDMCTISRCQKGVVMSNSSFSWWGAYLGHSKERTVVCPTKKWFRGSLGHLSTKFIPHCEWKNV